MLRPLDRFQVNALLYHFPQRAKITQVLLKRGKQNKHTLLPHCYINEMDSKFTLTCFMTLHGLKREIFSHQIHNQFSKLPLHLYSPFSYEINFRFRCEATDSKPDPFENIM